MDGSMTVVHEGQWRTCPLQGNDADQEEQIYLQSSCWTLRGSSVGLERIEIVVNKCKHRNGVIIQHKEAKGDLEGHDFIK